MGLEAKQQCIQQVLTVLPGELQTLFSEGRPCDPGLPVLEETKHTVPVGLWRKGRQTFHSRVKWTSGKSHQGSTTGLQFPADPTEHLVRGTAASGSLQVLAMGPVRSKVPKAVLLPF